MKHQLLLIASMTLASPAALAASQRGDNLRTDFVQTHQDHAERTAATTPEQTPAEARDEVVAQLVQHGVSQSEAQARAHAMTDAEAQALAAHFDATPAGGDSTITIGVGSAIIIALLLVIFL